MDGSTVRVPDTPENREAFGGQFTSGKSSSYPMVRIVVLMALRSHLLAAASFGRYEGVHELQYGKPLCSSIPGSSLTILDRGYLGSSLLLGIEASGDRHWLVRARTRLKMKVVERLGPGDDIVEMPVSPAARKQDASLPRTWRARRIQYQIDGFPEQALLTSLRDKARFPAKEIVELYHERWELELGYDEIKTDLLERNEAIRSKKPDGVRQELWGVLLAYNLVRLEMEALAKQENIEPTRISFIESLRLIRNEWDWLSVTSPGAIPKRLAALRQNVKRYILPPRRKRTYPRAVKIKISQYDHKPRRPELAK
jgi:hypothetical protein